MIPLALVLTYHSYIETAENTILPSTDWNVEMFTLHGVRNGGKEHLTFLHTTIRNLDREGAVWISVQKGIERVSLRQVRRGCHMDHDRDGAPIGVKGLRRSFGDLDNHGEIEYAAPNYAE
jgi:hypothetical protein